MWEHQPGRGGSKPWANEPLLVDCDQPLEHSEGPDVTCWPRREGRPVCAGQEVEVQRTQPLADEHRLPDEGQGRVLAESP